MQLKLLNFYKFLSNFANNLVGAFVPLIIFNVTGNITIAFAYLLAKETIRFVVTFLLKNKMQKNPQIFLLLRIITLTMYNIFIIMLDFNVWVAIIGICIFYAIDQCFKYVSSELIYNYSSLNKSGNSLGITRLFEQLGIIASILIGGVLLDIDRVLVVVISLGLYSISLIPLIIYYIKSRKSKSFNKDATSNAMELFNKDSKHSRYNRKIIIRILLSYALVYFVFCSLDCFSVFYQLELFFEGSNKYAMAGVFSAIFNAGYGLGSFIAGKLNDKIDITRVVQLSCALISLCMILLAFADSEVIIYIVFAVVGLVYPFISVFVLQRLLVKSRIIGVSNWAILFREGASIICYITMFGIGTLITLLPQIMIFINFIVISAAFVYSIYLIPRNEEKTRKLLVDFLEDNEITDEEKEKSLKESEIKAEK